MKHPPVPLRAPSLAAGLTRALLCCLAFALPGASAVLAEDRTYHIELLIFAHVQGTATASEDFLAEPQGPALDQVRVREFVLQPAWTDDGPVVEGLDEPDGLTTVSVPTLRRVLAGDELRLADAYRRLRGDGAYRPLAHAAWVQHGLAENGRGVEIDLGTQLGSALGGSLRVTRSRFLHLHLDIEYMAEDAMPLPVARGRGEDGLPTVRTLVPRYRLVQQRRMRDREVHYFDHPAFGVVATIHRLESPPEDQASDGFFSQ